MEITLLESELAHVYNPKYASGFYTARFPKGAQHLTCNCQAGQFGNYCKHRALVHEALLARCQQPATRLTDANWREAYAASVLVNW